MNPEAPSADYLLMGWASTAIALENGDPERLMPSLPPSGGRLLDLGCGEGRALIALGLEGWTAVGLDANLDALRPGRELLASHGRRQVSLTASTAEHLPFADESFDMVMSRAGLPYTLIPQAVAEISRVLRPGGTVWMTLHPPSMFRWRSIYSLRTAAYHAYIAFNTALFHYFGRQIRYPLKPSRVESYQTPEAIERCLAAHGFERIDILEHRPRRLVVEARKPRAFSKRVR